MIWQIRMDSHKLSSTAYIQRSTTTGTSNWEDFAFHAMYSPASHTASCRRQVGYQHIHLLFTYIAFARHDLLLWCVYSFLIRHVASIGRTFYPIQFTKTGRAQSKFTVSPSPTFFVGKRLLLILKVEGITPHNIIKSSQVYWTTMDLEASDMLHTW